MHHGRIQALGRPTDLRRQLKPQQHYVVRVDALDEPAEMSITQHVPDLRCVRADGYAELLFQAGQSDGSLAAVLNSLRQYEVSVLSVEGHPASLEEVFSHYTVDE